jgi:hypothetical protein
MVKTLYVPVQVVLEQQGKLEYMRRSVGEEIDRSIGRLRRLAHNIELQLDFQDWAAEA